MKQIDVFSRRFRGRTMLVCFPHPDDGTVWAAGLMMRARRLGLRVVVVSVTNGIAGRIYIHGRGKNMMEIRRHELNEAMRKLGIEEFEVWHRPDGQLKSRRRWRRMLAEFVEGLKSALVVTYDHAGVSGHSDHIALSLEMFEIVKRRRGPKLIWPAFVGKVRKYLESRKVETLDYMAEPELELKLKLWLTEWVRKFMALRAHKSQNLSRAIKPAAAYRFEHFAVADLGKKYKYKYVKFDI